MKYIVLSYSLFLYSVVSCSMKERVDRSPLFGIVGYYSRV